ncbi:hypothetical protein [Brevundimonas sp.]|uniref:hypothetical protein n=1 Tax=Brevundimonas sp. TaxID=1871086 RepID=UPI0037BEA16B
MTKPPILAVVLLLLTACGEEVSTTAPTPAPVHAEVEPVIDASPEASAVCVDDYIRSKLGLALMRTATEPLPGLMAFPVSEPELIGESFDADVVKICRATAQLATVHGKRSARVTYELRWPADGRDLEVKLIDAAAFQAAFTDIYRDYLASQP